MASWRAQKRSAAQSLLSGGRYHTRDVIEPANCSRPFGASGSTYWAGPKKAQAEPRGESPTRPQAGVRGAGRKEGAAARSTYMSEGS